MLKKVNCWEFKKCGREAGGSNVNELGECPASEEVKAGGIHGGINGGRCCWAVTGTYCKGEVQGSFTQKYTECRNCDFYQHVLKEETKELSFISFLEILDKLKE